MIGELILRSSNVSAKLINSVKNAVYGIRETSPIELLPYIIVILAFCFGETIILLLPLYRSLAWFCFYTAISNSCLSVFPHEPALLLYGSRFNPLLVAFLGALATCWIEIFNYRFLEFVTGIKSVKTITSKRKYQKVETWFNKAPFLSLFFAGLTPAPFSLFRFFAVNSRYPFAKFLVSVFVGRFPRYYILALTGLVVSLPSWIYGVFFVLLLGYAVWRKIQSRVGQ